MADRIELEGLELHGYHGVYDFEKRKGQKFIIDVVVWTDFAAASESDDISSTISYVDIADIAADVVTGPSLDLIETLASTIADRINELDGVIAVETTVHKPDAPIHHPFADVRVVARRSQKTPKVTRANKVHRAGRADQVHETPESLQSPQLLQPSETSGPPQ